MTKIEWSVYHDSGRTLCYCRKHEWNIKKCDPVCVCPVCGSIYEVILSSSRRFIHWQPRIITEEAHQIDLSIRRLKSTLRSCMSRELREQLYGMDDGDLYDFYDLVYKQVYDEITDEAL